MTGNELRNILKGKGVVLTDLAAQLGMSQQVLNSRLSVKQLKADFIQKVEDIVGFNVTEAPAPSVPSSVDTLIGLLQKKDEQIDRLISLLEHKYGSNEKEKQNVG